MEIERAERVAAAWLAQLASRHGHNKTHCIPFRRAEIVARWPRIPCTLYQSVPRTTISDRQRPAGSILFHTSTPGLSSFRPPHNYNYAPSIVDINRFKTSFYFKDLFYKIHFKRLIILPLSIQTYGCVNSSNERKALFRFHLCCNNIFLTFCVFEFLECHSFCR